MASPVLFVLTMVTAAIAGSADIVVIRKPPDAVVPVG